VRTVLEAANWGESPENRNEWWNGTRLSNWDWLGEERNGECFFLPV
jgi:hypothetical protein